MVFQDFPKRSSRRLLNLLAAASLVLLLALSFGFHALGSRSLDRQQQVLEQAVRESTVFCYSVEGTYPPDVSYLEKNYGLTYDKDTFFVGYRLQGSNLPPDITVIRREGGVHE